ncbi:MAG: DUF5615 family PIN-like protein [Candidatus Eisenbacteria bacterium]|nr:DUF5615 family PIN-like protein [Candidatus Eisenbacteria bacterium]
MKVWLDAQLPPTIAGWLAEQFQVEALPVRELGLVRATDSDIFAQARVANAVVLTKDRDFVRLLEIHGAPPQVVWITCGNTSNSRLREVLLRSWPIAARLLEAGEPLVEVSGAEL